VRLHRARRSDVATAWAILPDASMHWDAAPRRCRTTRRLWKCDGESIRDGSSDIAQSLNNLASWSTSLGRFSDALSAQQAALDMWKRVYKDQDIRISRRP